MDNLFEQQATKTEQTKHAYLLRAEQLINRAKRELNIEEDHNIDPRQLVSWLNEHKKNINSRSWRQYKSATLYFLEQQEPTPEIIEAIQFLRPITSHGTIKKTNRTSSQKLKKITLRDWQKLDDYLKNRRNKWYPELRLWLRAAIITGLRPSEWKNTTFTKVNNKNALIVKNAKNTNGRSFGEYRTLILENVSEDDVNVIIQHINNLKTFNDMGSYDYFYKGCSIALYHACRKCWPRRKKHITLYSTRHQFTANAKSSGMSRTEVAALMGHAVDETAGQHYGRKAAGNTPLKVTPIAEDVNKVKVKSSESPFSAPTPTTNDSSLDDVFEWQNI